MAFVTLKDGEKVPALGLGTWRLGERSGRRQHEIDALKTGLDLGISLIDTAEMYGEGGAERIIAKAMSGRRDEIFLVSKVYPHNASRRGTVRACERSLLRLETDVIDLYLLHWPGSYPLDETFEAFEKLKSDGKIRHWGVSNFDRVEMRDVNLATGGDNCMVNQVCYNLAERGIEWDLVDNLKMSGTVLMAYSPLAQGDMLEDDTLREVAARHDVAPATIALAWVLRQPQTVAIPKSSNIDHIRQNAAALDVELSREDLRLLDEAFPPPTGPTPLAIL